MSIVIRKRITEYFPSSSVQRPVKRARTDDAYTHRETGTLYGYKHAADGSYAYIGQTRQTLPVRDHQHQTGDQTTFDKMYSADKSRFTGPYALLTKVFETTGEDYDDVEARCKAQCDQWMDAHEVRLIKEHETYSSTRGLNGTEGGKNISQSVAFHLAQIKERNRKWEVDYMPEFRLSEWGQKGRLWEITYETPILGGLISNMRTGNTFIPPRFLTELNEMGYRDGESYQESKWEVDYMPEFRRCEWAQKKRFWEIPMDTPVLGSLLSCMRQGETSIPPHHLVELNEMGYRDGEPYQESKWKVDYMPEFRVCEWAQKKRLWEVPMDTPVLGSLLSCMRKGETSISPHHLVELNEMGYRDGEPYQESKWKVDYMPEFRLSEWAQKGRLWEIPQKTPMLGVLLDNMRTGNTFIPPRFLPELNEMGYRDGEPYQESKWEVDYMPEFRRCEWGQKGKLWEIPYETPMLGSLLRNMRTGQTSIPPRFLPELNKMGHRNGEPYQESKWEVDFMLEFRRCKWAQKGRLWEIPQKTPRLGSMLSRIRTGKTPIPSRHLVELNKMGYRDGKPHLICKWEVDYLPLCRTFVVNTNLKLDMMCMSLKMNNIKIGRVLHTLKRRRRATTTTVPDSVLVQLRQMGLTI